MNREPPLYFLLRGGEGGIEWQCLTPTRGGIAFQCCARISLRRRTPTRPNGLSAASPVIGMRRGDAEESRPRKGDRTVIVCLSGAKVLSEMGGVGG